MALGGFVLSLTLYLKGMRTMMFQLSGFYYNPKPTQPLWFSAPNSQRVGNSEKASQLPWP